MIPSIDQRVRLTKLSAHVEPPGMLPTDYWLEGILANDVRVGATIQVNRIRRARQNPDEPDIVELAGFYTSSPVVSLEETEDGVIATTRHSKWEIRLTQSGQQS